MNKIKRILSMVLVCMMALSLVPVTTLTASAAATGTTALFNGNATYLLQERFASPASLDGDATRVFSGWDVDYRGGDVTFDGGAMIIDSNSYEKTTMSHKLMKHTGALTFESVFTFKTPVDEGFYYEVSGGDNVAVRIETVRKAAGNRNVYFAVNGTATSIVAALNTEYHLKAEFTGSKVTVWLNGEKIADNMAYMASTSYLDEVEIGTGETGIGKIQIKNVYAYVNYTVNENFLGKALSGWDVANGEVVTVPGAPYSADTYGYALNTTEAIEPKYTSDNARVRVNADLDSVEELTWKGGTGVTLTAGQEIGGKKNVIMATGLGDGNATTVGVVVGDDFTFGPGDVLTYSIDVYSATGGSANVWLRNHGPNGLEPFTSFGHSLVAGKWITLKKSVRYEDFGGTGDWTKTGKYALYLRPSVSTLYIDNFNVAVEKSSGKYYTDATIGERVNWTKSLDAWDNDVMYGSNVSSLEYVTDPAGTKSGNVLKAVVGTAGAYGVVAVRLVDDFGSPIKNLRAGDVIDVSFDFRSSVAQGNSTNGVSLRIGDTSFANGVNAPTGTANDMGSVQVAANTWKTMTGSYTVPADVSITDTQTWYFPIRVPTAGTIYIDNFKVSIKNSGDAVAAPTWEIKTAADVTWKNGGTATDANGIGGRDNVVMLSNLANGNTNTAGIVLGNSFAFEEGDVLKYSFDAYSTAAIEPDLWLRNHGTSLNPFKQIDIASIPASTWTTRSGEIDYATLMAAGAFNTPDKFALYFRPNTSGTIYIDNFKVEVFNSNKHVVDLVDGARVKYTANKASDLTFANGLASDDATKGAIKMNLNGSGDGTSVGFNMGAGFSFKEGDTFTYSYDIYTETADVYPDFWLRERGGYLAMKTFYNPALTTGTWTTVTGTATYDQLIAEDADYATASNNWYAYIRLRNSKSATVWVKNFKVAVTRPEYAFGELPSNASLEKRFSALSGSQTLEFDVFVPAGGANGFSAKLGGATFKIANNKFYLGDTELYVPTNNVWYNIKVVNGGATATAYVNGVQRGSAAADGSITSVAFENTTGKKIMIDNVQVGPTFNYSDYADYPTLNDSDIANAQNSAGNLDLGMVSYPMWREGNHYGWDLITPYEDERAPHLGYYSGGSPEVADWNIKWWAEHGFDHVIYPYVRPNINEAGGQPSYSVRGEELHDGYMNAKYNDKVDFAIMLTNPLPGQFTDAEGNITDGQEWIDNVLPYLTETYFKKDNYKIVNNHLVVYNYNPQGFIDCLTITETTGEGDNETTNIVRDGTAEFIKILKALNAKAVELGYAGVMFVMDKTANSTDEIDTIKTAINNNSAVATLYTWRYSWGTDVGANVSTGIQSEYDAYNNKDVACIPMGFNATPWQSSKIGFMDVSEIETICNTVKTYRQANDPSIVLFTCWDEWGEGHFFSPASIHGFDYLNAARRILTDKAANITSATPTEDAKKRMGVLYPEGRQMLKIREDQKEALDPSILTQTLGTLTPSISNYVDRSGCNHNSVLSRDYKTFKITDAQQASVWYNAPTSIDYSKVTAIKVRGYSETAATLVVKYGTNNADNPFSDSVEPISYANRYRFSCANTPGTTTQEFVLLPDYPGKVAGAANEKIKYIRFNPQTNTAKNTKFYIESITFYMDDLPGFDVTVDEAKMTMVSEAPEGISESMLPAYKLLLDIGAKVTWDKSQKKLTATKNGVTAIYQDGFRNVVDPSNNVLATAPAGSAAKYDKGNLFVSYDVLLAPFGYTVTYNSANGNIDYLSAEFNKEYDDTDLRWDFEKTGDREGWSTVDGSDRYFTEGTGSAATVKDGVLHVRSAGTDSSIFMNFDTPVEKEKVKDFSMKIDTDAPEMYLRLYDDGTYSSGAGVTWRIKTADFPTGEIIINLEETPDRDGNMNFAKLSNNITKVRIDPILGRTGSNKIDYIQFGDPVLFRFKAYAFGENIFTNYDSAYWIYSGAKDKNGTTVGGWGVTPTIGTVDGFEKVITIQPTDGQTHGFTGITWLHSGEGVGELETYVTGKITRVSFDYKAVGDAYQFRFENRDTANGRDGEEYIVAATSEWQHFDGYINHDETESTGRRTYAIRAFRNSTSGDGAILIKDWQIRVLDETTEVGYFTDSGVAIKAINLLNTEIANDKVYVGAFDTVNKELNNFTSGNVPNDVTVNTNETTKPETLPYYYMSPTDATTEIRAYWWDQLEPLCEPFVLQKAN